MIGWPEIRPSLLDSAPAFRAAKANMDILSQGILQIMNDLGSKQQK
jgi:hypothetical protein